MSVSLYSFKATNSLKHKSSPAAGGQIEPMFPVWYFQRTAWLDLTLRSQTGAASLKAVGDKVEFCVLLTQGRVHVCVFLCVWLSVFHSSNPNALHSYAGGAKKGGGGGIKAVLSSGYAKSAEDSICKPGLAVQTMHDYISGLHAFPCPLFPIFPGEKIMWLGCVILLKLRTPDNPERMWACVWMCVCANSCCRLLSVCISTCAGWKVCGHPWVCLFSWPLTGSIAGERLAFRVGGPLICSATAEVG